MTDATAGLLQLCGHPWFGGLRITLYNGVRDESASRVVDFMKKFKERHA